MAAKTVFYGLYIVLSKDVNYVNDNMGQKYIQTIMEV